MKLHFTALLLIQVLLVFVVNSNQRRVSDQCPPCVIPCGPPCEDKPANSTFIRTYDYQGNGYTVVSLIDASSGEALIMLSNRKGKIYSKSVTIVGYRMDHVCEFFSDIPTVSLPDAKRRYVLVTFKYFPVQKLLQMNEMESKYFSLFQKTSLVVNDQKETIQKLNNVISDHETFEDKIEMRKKLEYAIMRAKIYGNTYRCKPANYKLELPISARRNEHCLIDNGNWLYFDLAEEVTLNLIQMYHWDSNNRLNYYTLEVSVDKSNWVRLASNKQDVRLSTIELSEARRVRYIRMTGYNTGAQDMTIYWLRLDWV